MSWTDSEILKLKRLSKSKESFKAIAEEMGRHRASVSWAAKKYNIKLKNPIKMGSWNSKHAHLRKRAMTYFLSHSFEETAKKFNLTNSELKSLMTISYRMPELSHLRKDRRTKKLWDIKDTLFLLRHAGIQSRSWIAKELSRASKEGSHHAVKDRLKALKVTSKYINGLPSKWVKDLLNLDTSSIKTRAGPFSKSNDFRLKTVPWVFIYRQIKHKRTVPKDLKMAIRAMSKFQKFIHQTDNEDLILRRLKGAARKI